MYGLVNRAIEDLIVSTEGAETWEKIKKKAGTADLQLLDSSNYDDQLTYDLVAACCEVLNKSAEEVLYAFGRHWILYTGKEGWANLFAFTGDNFISFVQQLDEMHARVNAAMPEGNMPEFTLSETDDGYQLIYRSAREGLAPMVIGILNGLAEQFNESWEIKHIGTREKSGVDSFALSKTAKLNELNHRDAA
ncbi:MAG: heme NO-binding domain-containing protein [Granulosicoccus sp.]|nr:heme NO-binding domain-containing protein [Granulosicoccus sp.]